MLFFAFTFGKINFFPLPLRYFFPLIIINVQDFIFSTFLEQEFFWQLRVWCKCFHFMVFCNRGWHFSVIILKTINISVNYFSLCNYLETFSPISSVRFYNAVGDEVTFFGPWERLAFEKPVFVRRLLVAFEKSFDSFLVVV